jgi:ribonucleoside-triphosphate reductase
MNLPRASYNAGRNQANFFKFLDEQLEMTLRALEIKYRTIKRRVREGLLPFLTQEADGDCYFRLENSSRLVGFVGLNEAVKSFFGKALHEDEEALRFAEEVIKNLSKSVKKCAKKPRTRPVLSMVSNANAAKRLAESDVEKYGWAKVQVQGAKDQPFYTDLVAVPLDADISWENRLNIEQKFHKLTPGSHLAVIQLADSERDPNELLSTTKRITEKYDVGLYAYNWNLAYCARCQKVFYGTALRCPSCGSVNTLINFSRVSAKYSPSLSHVPAQRAHT